ncbi:alpha-L-rhamnosidase N-terminal domain-containing protein [Streptomyces sp. SAS_270]|uniref:alpha-L-rhamnosidase N-terminal domain-containing protein n=1 Tax=Streptomyces sp. SAS_270 TaxID=3412748 RepID=UPI00403D1E29
MTRPDGSWKATDNGPYRADDIYDGQTYDARKELPGWTSSRFDDSDWSGTNGSPSRPGTRTPSTSPTRPKPPV